MRGLFGEKKRRSFFFHGSWNREDIFQRVQGSEQALVYGVWHKGIVRNPGVVDIWSQQPMKLHPSFCAPEAIFLLAGMVYGSVRDTEFDNSIGLELWTSEALGVLGQILFPWTNGWPFSHSPPPVEAYLWGSAEARLGLCGTGGTGGRLVHRGWEDHRTTPLLTATLRLTQDTPCTVSTTALLLWLGSLRLIKAQQRWHRKCLPSKAAEHATCYTYVTYYFKRQPTTLTEGMLCNTSTDMKVIK